MKKLKQLKKHHATLLEEAAKFRTADGQFADDAARASFDAKMVEADKVQAQIRTLEAAEDDEPLPVQTDTVTAEQRSAIITAERDARRPASRPRSAWPASTLRSRPTW
jgi:hypothetical protein